MNFETKQGLSPESSPNKNDKLRMVNEKILIIKATYRGVTKKIPYNNEDVTLDEFLVMLQRIFRSGPISSPVLHYLDEDKDWIAVSDSDELAFAMSTSDFLRVRLTSGDDESASTQLDTEVLGELRREFTKLQTAIAGFLLRLQEISASVGARSQTNLSESFAKTLDLKDKVESRNDGRASNENSVRETRETMKATQMGRSLSPTPSEPPKYQANLGRQASDLPSYQEMAKTSDPYRPPVEYPSMPPMNTPQNIQRLPPRMGFPPTRPTMTRPPMRPEMGAPQISALDGQPQHSEKPSEVPSYSSTRFPTNPSSAPYQPPSNPGQGPHFPMMYPRSQNPALYQGPPQSAAPPQGSGHQMGHSYPGPPQLNQQGPPPHGGSMQMGPGYGGHSQMSQQGPQSGGIQMGPGYGGPPQMSPQGPPSQGGHLQGGPPQMGQGPDMRSGGPPPSSMYSGPNLQQRLDPMGQIPPQR